MTAPLPDDVPVREGDLVAGKYVVERILGQGGMGVVVAAHHTQLDERVALKFLRPGALASPETVARFVREARAAVRIKSEHVVRVMDVGTLPNGAPYLVMEYLEGLDLAAWLEQRGPLPVDRAVEFLLQACVALAEAHGAGIVHRDLKPANLFCTWRSDGEPVLKVLDFGISKLAPSGGLDPSIALTRTTALMGSPLYMSPEQMRASRDVDAATDIWALGVILFELLTGRPAFTADTVTELAIRVANEPAPSVRELRADLPPGLDVVVGKCLEKDRRNRYGNVADLARALAPFAPPRSLETVRRIAGIVAAGRPARPSSVAASNSAEAHDAAAPSSPRDLAADTFSALGQTAKKLGHRRMAFAALGALGVVSTGLVVAFLLRPSGAAKSGMPGSEVSSAALPPVGASVQAPSAAAPATAAAPSADRSTDSVLTANASDASAPVQPESSPASASRALAASRAAADVARPAAQAPRGPRTAPTAATAAAATSAAPASCDPPFYFDSKGTRIYKKECL